jgi:hypothetical protein
LKDDANDKFRELTICVALSLASTAEAVQNTPLAVKQLGPGLAVVNDAVQAVSPLATEITAQFNAWQPLLNRLTTLVKVADLLAEVCFTSDYLCSATAKKYLQTGPPLDQVSMGSCLSSI